MTVAVPGSYYLTGNLIGSAGLNGITINGDDICIDLNGFSLIGVASIESVSFVLADRYPTFWPILLGLLLLLVVLFRRTGLVGLVVTERERLGRFGRAPSAGAVGRGYGTA